MERSFDLLGGRPGQQAGGSWLYIFSCNGVLSRQPRWGSRPEGVGCSLLCISLKYGSIAAKPQRTLPWGWLGTSFDVLAGGPGSSSLAPLAWAPAGQECGLPGPGERGLPSLSSPFPPSFPFSISLLPLPLPLSLLSFLPPSPSPHSLLLTIPSLPFPLRLPSSSSSSLWPEPRPSCAHLSPAHPPAGQSTLSLARRLTVGRGVRGVDGTRQPGTEPQFSCSAASYVNSVQPGGKRGEVAAA